ncbi:MAG: tRNA (N6-isopentenyl adenosine(37)-C2)-methylthiotransferase MiaB [Bacteroidetes bacterium]|nr:tRNA (N6-isopentenyl adenosine(37)-C2)-methylthiotransferase MiaB [Bacteroidota bacterium]
MELLIDDIPVVTAKKKLYIETYGCAMNVSDSEIVASVLVESGMQQTNDEFDADVVLINTCAIRENAELKIWHRLTALKNHKRKKPGLIVGVLGCMAERLKSKLLEQQQLVDLVVGPDAYRDLPKLISQAEDGEKAVNVILSREETYAELNPIRLNSNGVSAFISIMRGCNNMCSFCVVPFTRGRERSRDALSIIREAEDLKNNGYKEVTLLGQNVDSYHWTSEDGTDSCNFAQLLERVALVSPDIRVRFSTSHPKDITDEVMHTIAKYENICNYIHLPVQSGNSRILEMMNRTYDREWYMSKVKRIREIIPDCGISSDIISGFCSETEEEHRDTLSIIEWAQFDYSYMYSYSERPGTLAARKYKDDVSAEDKSRRLTEIIEVQHKISYESKAKFLGKVSKVLVEGFSKRSQDDLMGRNDQNNIVIFPKGKYKKGDYVNVLIESYNDQLNRKMIESPFLSSVEKPEYFTYFRRVKKELEIYREENIPLQVEIQTLTQKYGAISGAMTVEMEGKTLTLQQAANYFKHQDRALRQEAFEKISARRLQDADELDSLFDQLIALRTQVAKNAGFDNFRDYMFAALGRFDYTLKDCEDFHESVKLEVVPLVKKLDEARKQKLSLDNYRPWDTEVDTDGKEALKPFKDGKELLAKTHECFNLIDPQFKSVIEKMESMGHFDLESRIGKAPIGYNYPLEVSGYQFIFMNAAGNTRDVETMVHEAGHAFHSVLSHSLELNAMKSFPSEVAELASMSMELISSDAQQVFYANKEDHKRAQIEHLEGVIEVLPWIAIVDKFQHWIYTNATHTREERKEAWLRISGEFSTKVVDWSGYEHIKPFGWHKQLHIFEVPFYYIEYGIAQLGAIGVWRNYLANHTKGLQMYKNALTLGYSATMPEIYKTAGVQFNFSQEYIKSLFVYVQQQLDKMNAEA